MSRRWILLAAALPLTACSDEVPAVDPAPDATQELVDPDEDDILDVDPLSRQDGQTEDDSRGAETGDEVLPSVGDRITPDEVPERIDGEQP